MVEKHDPRQDLAIEFLRQFESIGIHEDGFVLLTFDREFDSLPPEPGGVSPARLPRLPRASISWVVWLWLKMLGKFPPEFLRLFEEDLPTKTNSAGNR